MKLSRFYPIALTLLLGAGLMQAAPKPPKTPNPEKKPKNPPVNKIAKDLVAQYYTIGKLVMPPGVNPQVGGMDMMPDGRLAVCFHHGEVAIYQPKDKSWKIFAEGLHEPLGILVENEKSILVMQRPELTRLVDEDGDGVADSYQTVWDGFGMTGNYHEFAFGPAKGPDGKLYVALNTASGGAGIREEVRGEFSPLGDPKSAFDKDGKKAPKSAGRMYSKVPYRGWVFQIDPSTNQAVPYASGFRSPDGINFDNNGNLWVSDNQGDWRGACEMHLVKKGGFYGHPASLAWREGWKDGYPLDAPIEKLNALRIPAAVWFPYGYSANSATQMIMIPKTPAWGPYGGQMLIGEMNSPRLLRVLPEEVEGVEQGACVILLDNESLGRGLHRFAFSGNTLYMGKTHLSWAGGEGISTLTPTGKFPFDARNIYIKPKGFVIEFTEPLNEIALDKQLWPVQRYSYLYHKEYGSPKIDIAMLTPDTVELSKDKKSVTVTLPELKTDVIYEFNLSKLTSAKGAPVTNGMLAYTVRKVPK